MLIEMLLGTDNVIRFPVEMREKPSMRLLYQLQPDVRTPVHARGGARLRVAAA